ncbi:GNAT family acetyltransferase [Ceratobasidium sp. AG-Ba]|nr:GNAT family acetyltransferase [Ceratobasidium sp. AG-Ba]QRW05057.1 GNAT family acetyltransferase [Ceratobasidium sp. AG-Ba]
MRLNENTAIVGQKVVLVPYRAEHVPKYHEWMTDPELLELTASEPLTLEEEMDMQRKWREDADKLTFIILARTRSADSPEAMREFPMVGDVNLFLKDTEAEDGTVKKEAEVEIMIAEREYRRKGLAQETLGLFLNYVTQESLGLALSPYQLVVRIGTSNAPSRALFERLGFIVSKEVAVFDEVEMRWCWDMTGSQPAISEDTIRALWGSGGKLVDYPRSQVDWPSN